MGLQPVQWLLGLQQGLLCRVEVLVRPVVFIHLVRRRASSLPGTVIKLARRPKLICRGPWLLGQNAKEDLEAKSYLFELCVIRRTDCTVCYLSPARICGSVATYESPACVHLYSQ